MVKKHLLNRFSNLRSRSAFNSASALGIYLYKPGCC